MTESHSDVVLHAEIVDSWPRWIRLAEATGDESLAARLVSAVPPDVLKTDEHAVLLARSAILDGRPQDAVDQLRGTELRPPHDARALDVVTAAARAATTTGVVEYRWLLAHVAHVRGTAEEGSALRLLAAVADFRNDATTADDAWERLATSVGLSTPQSFARLAATIITQRDREATPAALATLALHAGTVALAGPTSDHPDVQPGVNAATSLADRGDAAGAGLLLRALRSLDRDTDGRTIDAALVRAVPPPLRTRFAAMHAGAALAGAAIGVGATLVDSRTWLLAPLLSIGGAVLWGRFARLGPLNAAERRAWHALSKVRIDGETGAVRGRERDALGALIAILASIMGVMAATQLASWVADRLGQGHGWAPALVWILVAPVPPVGLLILHSRVRSALNRRAGRKRLIAEARRDRSVAERCACWSAAAVVGRGALYYLEGHLSVVSLAAPSSIDLDGVRAGTTTARCPVTGALWLVVPAVTGDLLLLKGTMSTHEAVVPPAPSGFYL